VCAWIEENLVHAEGDYLGEPFLLEPWQQRIVWRLYAYDPQTRRRLVRRALFVMPKGCGKTELTAAIGLAELAGPVVLDAQASRPLPVRRKAPNIPVGAASFEQADRLYGAARVMATNENSGLAPFVEAYDTEMLLAGGELGRMFRVAAEAGTNDGGLPTCFLADEVHEWVGRKARVHLVISNSLAKRQDSLEVNISTPDDADPQSLLGTLVAYGQRVNSGEVDDPSFVFEHWSAGDPADPDGYDLHDPQQLRAAIRAATPAGWVDVDRVASKLEVDGIPDHEFRRYWLAQFVSGSGAWLPVKAWQELAVDREVPAGSEVVLGFDGSYNGDSTALVGVALGEVPHVFVVDEWERPVDQHGRPRPGYESWKVPREEVKAKVAWAFDRWQVREMACDPPGWHKEIEEWAEEFGDPPVIEFRTNQPTKMAPACSKFYKAVRFGLMTHDGDPRLARHLRNARTKETADGAYITKDGRNSPRKIDLAVGAVIAFDRATSPELSRRSEPWVAVW